MAAKIWHSSDTALFAVPLPVLWYPASQSFVHNLGRRGISIVSADAASACAMFLGRNRNGRSIPPLAGNFGILSLTPFFVIS